MTTLPPLGQPALTQSTPVGSCQNKPKGQVYLEKFIEEWTVYPNGQRYFKAKYPIGGYAHTPKRKKVVKKEALQIKKVVKKDIL